MYNIIYYIDSDDHGPIFFHNIYEVISILNLLYEHNVQFNLYWDFDKDLRTESDAHTWLRLINNIHS